jgi:hypothetical protein
MEVNARNIDEIRESILAQPPASKQAREARPPIQSLPPHLDRLINLPWTSDLPWQVDQWLWYIEQEFETVGGWQ